MENYHFDEERENLVEQEQAFLEAEAEAEFQSFLNSTTDEKN